MALCTEQVRAMQYLIFIPAFVHIKNICEKESYSPRGMIMRFGEYCDKQENSGNDHENAFLKFYDWCVTIGRKPSDYSELNIYLLDQPDKSRQIRLTQEWNGKPFPKEVYADSGTMDLYGYTRWEIGRQEKYLKYAHNFMGVRD